MRLSAFAADSAGELDILGHDGDALGVNRAQVGVFEQTHQIRLRRFLWPEKKPINSLWSKMGKNTDKIAIIHCPTSEGVSEVSKRTNE